MERALTVGADENLALFCAYLGQRHVVHRVYEERGVQVLEVRTAQDAEQVRADYAAWRDGRLQLQSRQQSAPQRSWLTNLRGVPVLATLIGLTLLAFPATFGLDNGVAGPLLPWLTIVPLEAGAPGRPVDALAAMLRLGQWWRLVTPIFVHFGLVHLLFNVAVVFEFGRRIERGAGSALLFALILLIAVASNVAQFVMTNAALFGGLSGVAYGLFGYVVVRGRFEASPVWQVNRSFALSVLIILVLMSSGVTELFGLYIANAAHWVGLAVGAVAALVWRPRHKVSNVA